ncbi:MAG: hypothetical protein MUF43_08375 [Flavobacterium sp.]|nr:hypothetical protein [Flavobacterium sp.]
MPIVSILTFFAIFIFIVFIGIYIFLTFYNKRKRTAIDRFIGQVSLLRPTVFQDIKLNYSETSGLKTYIYPNSRCDLYLFDKFLAIVRRQDFVFKVFFAPVLLTSDIATTKNSFNYLDIYKPDRITIKKNEKGEINIKFTDPTYKHYKTDIILKGLTIEQTAQLEEIKDWC